MARLASVWTAWRLDPHTVAWSIWIVWFAVWETWAIVTPQPADTLTAHLRPIFAEHPLAWFLTLGLWLWVGFHFLVEGVFVPATGNG